MISYLSWPLIGSLCLCVVLAWALPRRFQAPAVALCTAGYLGAVAPLSFGILCASTLAVHQVAGRRRPTTAAVLGWIGALAAVFLWFKLRATLSNGSLLVPLGLSYYAFRQIHFLFESYKGKLTQTTLSSVVCYLFFLPTLLVGPIHRYPAFARDLRRRRWDAALFSSGLERILFGYFKVVVVAGVLAARFAGQGWLPDGPPFVRTYLGCLFSWIKLYLEFSGYSDIAIGFSALLGFEIIENFRFPFLAENIGDFWNRWHISLTSWCRDYVYQPALVFTRRPFASMCVTMTILGLWHELSLRYVLWGAYHGIGISIWHAFRRRRPQGLTAQKPWLALPARVAATAATLSFVVLSYPVTNYAQEWLRASWGRILTCMHC